AVEPSAVALTVEEPEPTAVKSPAALTVTTFVLLLTQFVTWLLNGTLERFEKFARAVPCCEVPPTIVVFATEIEVKPRNEPWLVMILFCPKPSLTAICSAVNGPFQMRNSSMLPFIPASPLNNERPSQELTLFRLTISMVVERALTSLPFA